MTNFNSEIRHFKKTNLYTHPTLEKQLENGFRTFELDFHLKADGIMNYHEQLWDQQTHCYCLSECLQTMYRFSEENPKHSPITIILEPKNRRIAEDSYPVFEEISLENILSMEQEILNVLGSEKLITPDSIRLENKSLGESIKTRGWPSVYDLQGLFMFILWDQGHRGLSREIYEPGTNHLTGRLLFTSQFLKDYSAFKNFERIKYEVLKNLFFGRKFHSKNLRNDQIEAVGPK